MVSVGVGKALGSLENSGMVGKDSLKVRVCQGCLKLLNGMEFEKNERTIFFE